MMEWLVAVSLLVPATAILLWPLWRHTEKPLTAGADGMQEDADQDRHEEKKRLLANLRALRADFAEGKIVEEDFRELQAEYQQQLAPILEGREQVCASAPIAPRPDLHRAGSLALLLLVGVTSLLLFNHYWKTAPAARSAQEVNVDAMVERLAARLAANPDDIEGQMMLARSYAALGRSSDALESWRKALELEPGNAEARGSLAVQLLQTGGELEVREALRHIAQLRQSDPADTSWLWYESMGQDLLGQRNQARATLEKLLAMLPPDSEKAAMVSKALAQMTPAK